MRSLSLAITALICITTAHAGEVAIKAYDSNGKPLTVTIQEFRHENGIDYGQHLSSQKDKAIPSGMYSYRVKAGSTDRRGHIIVREGLRLLVLYGESSLRDPVSGTEFILDYGPPTVLTGKLLVNKPSLLMGYWIRLQSVLDMTRYYDGFVGSDGTFKIPAAPPGNCIAIIFRDGVALHTQLVAIPDKQSAYVEIPLNMTVSVAK